MSWRSPIQSVWKNQRNQKNIPWENATNGPSISDSNRLRAGL